MSPRYNSRGGPQSTRSFVGRRMGHVEGGDGSISILSPPSVCLGWHKADMASGIVLDASGSSCTSLFSTGGAASGGCHHTTCSFAKPTSSSSPGLRQGNWRRSVSFKSAFKVESRRKFSAGCVVCETKEAPGVANDVNFKETVLESSTLVLVDFWAPWCGPCRMLDPVIESIADKYKGKVKCVKLNTDESSKTATELGIRSIPTCMIFKGGERLDTVIGCVPETTLTAVLDKYIST